MALPIDARTRRLFQEIEKHDKELRKDLETLAFSIGIAAVAARRRITMRLARLRKIIIAWAARNLTQYIDEAIRRVAAKAPDALSISMIAKIRDSVLPRANADMMLNVDIAINSILALSRKAADHGPGSILRKQIDRSIVTDETIDKLRKKVVDALENGIVSIVGVSGAMRRYSFPYYIALVATLAKVKADRQTVLDTGVEAGLDLVQVSLNFSTIGDFCDALRGKIFSITGTSPDFVPISEAPNGGPPFHPWCHHSLIPVVLSEIADEDLEALSSIPEEVLGFGPAARASEIQAAWESS